MSDQENPLRSHVIHQLAASAATTDERNLQLTLGQVKANFEAMIYKDHFVVIAVLKHPAFKFEMATRDWTITTMEDIRGHLEEDKADYDGGSIDDIWDRSQVWTWAFLQLCRTFNHIKSKVGENVKFGDFIYTMMIFYLFEPNSAAEKEMMMKPLRDIYGDDRLWL